MIHPRRPRGLTGQVAALVIVAASLTAALAAGLGFSLARGPAQQRALATLHREAQLVGRLADTRAQLATTPRGLGERQILMAQQVKFGQVLASGQVRGAAAPAVTRADVATVLAGHSVTGERRSGAGDVLLDIEPLARGGGLALAEPASTARNLSGAVARRAGLALALAVALAGGGGVLLARRITRPLREVAGGAHALALGERGTTVRGSGSAEVVEVAEALTALDGALAAGEKAQREFLVSVSHELRTPLTAIRGFAESLRDGVSTDVPVAADVIVSEAERVERLVGDLLDLARLRADRFSLDVAPLDVTALVADTARAWSPRCAAADVQLVVTLAGDRPAVATTDGDRLRQILDVLLANALRLTPAGGSVALSAEPEAGQLVVAVADTGPGLGDDDIAVAFEPGALHARYAGVRPSGSGVGLALAAALAARLDIGLGAGRAAGGGARFTVRVPLADDAAVREQPPG